MLWQLGTCLTAKIRNWGAIKGVFFSSHMNPDVASSGLLQRPPETCCLTESPSSAQRLSFSNSAHNHILAVEPLGILSVFQAGKKEKTKGEGLFFVACLALVWEMHNPLWNLCLCRGAILAVLEIGTSSRFSSRYGRSRLRRWLERVLSKNPWVSAACLPVTSLKVPWGHLPSSWHGTRC